MSILFRIVSSLNHFQLPVFMLSKVIETILRQFLGFYCLSKLRIWLNHDAFFMSLLFRIVSSLNHFQLHLFMLSKLNNTQLRKFLGFYILSKLRIWLNHDAFFISILFRIVSSLNHFQLPLFMLSNVNNTQLRKFLGFYILSKLRIWLNHDAFFMSILFRIVSNLNHFQLPLFMLSKVNETFFRQFLGLNTLLQLRIWLNHDAFFNSILFRIVSSMNHFQLHPFMLSKVNEKILGQFLGIYCLSKLRIWLNHDAFFMSLLFRIVSSLNHFQIPLFMLSNVNNTQLRKFLGFYCLSKLRIWLNHDAFFMSLLFRIVSSLNHFQLPLFMLSNVNNTQLRKFLGFYCLSKLRIWLNHDAFFMSLLFMIVSSLNHFQLPLFMLTKVNETFLRQFLGLNTLLQLRIWLNHDAFFMSLLFRIVSSLNHFQLPVFMLRKVNETILRQFLGFYCLSKLRIWLNHDAFFMSILFRIVSSLNHFQIPLFMLSNVNITQLRKFLGFYCLSKLRIWLNHDAFFMSILFRIVSSLNHFQLPLFMLTKVNETFLRQFLGLNTLLQLRIWLNHDAFFMSILFRIVSSLNHFQLPLFMLSNVNNTQLRKFLGFYCLSKLRIWLNHDAFFISILFRIVSSLNHFQLPLFMLSNVNNTQLRKFLGFYILSKLRIWLNHDAFFMSILFRIVSNLNHFQLPLFMLSKVNETFFRQFLGLNTLLQLRIWLNHDAFFMSILFRIVSSLNHFQLPLFMLSNVNNTQLRKFLGFYCLSKLRIWLNHDAFFMSLLFMIVSSLNHFQLPLFMLSYVNNMLLRSFQASIVYQSLEYG